MIIDKRCKTCGKDFTVPSWRNETAKFCSKICQSESLKADKNTICGFCGLNFHLKESQKERYSRKMGFFCSSTCSSEYKKTYFKGENNHQFGLKGILNSSFKGEVTKKTNHANTDFYIYVGEDYPKNKKGRVLLPRFMVNESYSVFDISFFDEINGLFILKDIYDVHHKDENHENNVLSNFELLTRSEHTSLHNKKKEIIRDEKNGKILTIKKIK